MPLTRTRSGLTRPFAERTTVQYRHPCGVWTLLVRLTSRFIGDYLADFGISVGITGLQVQDYKGNGGEGGIRTPDTLSGMPVFKTGAINHSATSPAHYSFTTISILRQQPCEIVGAGFARCSWRWRKASIAGLPAGRMTIFPKGNRLLLRAIVLFCNSR